MIPELHHAGMDKLLYTAKELAPLLGLAERTIREWGLTGTEGFPGPIIERPTKKLWDIRDVQEWLDRRRAR